METIITRKDEMLIKNINYKNYMLEITKLAYEVSTKTNNDVFVYYSPHVNKVEIMIHYGGWFLKKEPIDYSFYLHHSQFNDDPLMIIEILKELLKHGE